jgi:hypothetical protein
MSGTTSDALYLPRELEYICGMDWGFRDPGVIVWVACLPDHRLHVVKEWKFLETVDEEIASGWKKRTRELGVKVRYVAADPSMWIRDGRTANRGQSRAETLIRAGMPLRKAENAREDGWSRLHSLLRVPSDDDGNVTGAPLLTIDESCKYLRRSIPAAQSDKNNADDVNTKGDDHGLDALRYAAMSRPSPTVFRLERQIVPGTWGAELEDAIAGTRPGVLGSDNVRALHG